jgi:hypothetical protein
MNEQELAEWFAAKECPRERLLGGPAAVAAIGIRPGALRHLRQPYSLCDSDRAGAREITHW